MTVSAFSAYTYRKAVGLHTGEERHGITAQAVGDGTAGTISAVGTLANIFLPNRFYWFDYAYFSNDTASMAQGLLLKPDDWSHMQTGFGNYQWVSYTTTGVLIGATVYEQLPAAQLTNDRMDWQNSIPLGQLLVASSVGPTIFGYAATNTNTKNYYFNMRFHSIPIS